MRSFRTRRFLFALSIAALGCFFANSTFAQPIRIRDEDAKKAAIQQVPPTYSPLARQMNLTGRVLLDLMVDTDGSVEKSDVVSGNPILATSAVTAAKRWKFKPFQADGKPTEAVVRIAFDFSK
jgi:periplasmic protein TonB